MVMAGSINIRAIVGIMAKARLDGLSVKDSCHCDGILEYRETSNSDSLIVQVNDKTTINQLIHAKVTFTNNTADTINNVMLECTGQDLGVNLRDSMLA